MTIPLQIKLLLNARFTKVMMATTKCAPQILNVSAVGKFPRNYNYYPLNRAEFAVVTFRISP